MTENIKQDGLLKGVVKGIKEGLTFSSILDPDMGQKKLKKHVNFLQKK
ncbi:hypothetical protein [Bacillus sp. AFS088145]|nr:hypothetical protein [Bacillus sp. AFS088145]